MHLFPQADPLIDFEVRHDGLTPVLREGVDGRTRYEIRPLEEGERRNGGTEEVENIHFSLVVNFNNLLEGVGYDIVDSGPYIAVWNIDAPQPTEEELQVAWEDMNTVSLEQYKEDKIHLLSGLCQSEILADFTSDALGSTHTYGFDQYDQINLQAIGVNLAIDPDLVSVDWKTRESVVLVHHTREQIIQVIKDAATHQKSAQYKYLNLKYEIQEAPDKATVDTINW
jgi:hypothetical protein